jgi:hypothetical protein
MALTAGTPDVVVDNFSVFEATGAVTVTGNYTTTGVTLDLSNIVPSNSSPLAVFVYEQPAAGASASGNYYAYARGTTPANGAVQVFLPGGAQLGNGQSMSTNNVANLRYWAVLKKFV